MSSTGLPVVFFSDLLTDQFEFAHALCEQKSKII